MAYTSEIEKLERRWAENPKGRNFAPLADAYRKAGELDRAIELCRAGLQLHPDYVSAHIVYGRCLADQKDDAGATEVFRKVLALDPENVLALKVLAELAERGGRFEEAVEWLAKLLAVDPMNGDAAEALAKAKAKVAPTAKPTEPMLPAAAPPTPPPSPSAPEAMPVTEATTVQMGRPEFVVERTSAEPVAPEFEPARPAGEIQTYNGILDFESVAPSSTMGEGVELQEEVELEPQELVVEGLARTQYESGMFAAPAPPEATPRPEEELPHVDLPLIMPEDLSPLEAAATPAQRVSAPVSPPPPPPTPAAVVLSDDDGAADTAALSRAEPVLTETMAELYLRQGHREDALRVYQALLEQRPDDARLQARVEALSYRKSEGGMMGESVQAFLKRVLAGRPGLTGQPAVAPASPLDSAFAVAPPEPEVSLPGSATRPAEDSISLDQVFDDEAARGSLPGIDFPAPEPAATAEPAAAEEAESGGFSFDQFFSPPAPPTSPASGGAPAGAGSAAAKSPTRPSGPKGRTLLKDEDDLDQFQAWLKGLKS